jgi:hypothetical protein
MKRLLMRRIATALLILLMTFGVTVVAGPIGYSVRSDVDNHLYSIDLSTGAATDLGAVGLADAEGLEFVGSTLYGIGGSVMEFWNITTPPGFKIGNTGSRSGIDAGLAYDSTKKKMYNIQRQSPSSWLYDINISTGAATLIGTYTSGGAPDALAINSRGVAYALNATYYDSLYTVDLSNGALTLVGALGVDLMAESGLAFDPASGVLYGIIDTGKIYQINTSTGAATFVADTLGGFEGLAIIPEPATICLLGLGALSLLRRKR